MFSNRKLFVLVILVAVVAAACARQPDPSGTLPASDLGFRGQLAGFAVGFLHGAMIFVNMVASLFLDVRIYTFPKSGRLYDLGFVLGTAAVLASSSSARTPKVDV